MLGAVAGGIARQQIEHDIGQHLVMMAEQLTNEVDRSLFERYREIQIIAEFEIVHGLTQARLDQRPLLERLQQTYSAYTWIGFTNEQGVVLASTQGLLEGVSVAQRDWFVQAQDKPFVGDVHEALLLSQLLPRPADQPPLRLLDVAAPVYDDQGERLGVLGAHITWQ